MSKGVRFPADPLKRHSEGRIERDLLEGACMGSRHTTRENSKRGWEELQVAASSNVDSDARGGPKRCLDFHRNIKKFLFFFTRFVFNGLCGQQYISRTTRHPVFFGLTRKALDFQPDSLTKTS